MEKFPIKNQKDRVRNPVMFTVDADGSAPKSALAAAEMATRSGGASFVCPQKSALSYLIFILEETVLGMWNRECAASYGIVLPESFILLLVFLFYYSFSTSNFPSDQLLSPDDSRDVSNARRDEEYSVHRNYIIYRQFSWQFQLFRKNNRFRETGSSRSNSDDLY